MLAVAEAKVMGLLAQEEIIVFQLLLQLQAVVEMEATILQHYHQLQDQ